MNIFEWLTNPQPKYTDGIELFKQFNPRDKQYISYFEQLEDSKKGEPHFDMLFKRIARIARVQGQQAKDKVIEHKKIAVEKIITGKKTKKPAVKTEETPEKKRIRIAGEFELVNPKDLSKELQIVFFDVKTRFANMKELHNKIKDAKPDDNVKALTEEITALEEINYKDWGKIDAVLKDGQPEKNTESRTILQEVLENERRIKTLNINIPRAVKDLENLELNKGSTKDSKELKSINGKIKGRKKNIPLWKSELKKLEARQIEIKNAE